jgi:LysM repeat protein
MAGLAAAFALGNAPAAAHAAGAATGHHPAAKTAVPQAAAPQAQASAAQLLSITQRPTAGAPVVRLNATQVAAIQPKGKHHRTATAKYVVKSGDTLASIAQRLYHSPDYWTVLYWANHGAIKYANEIQAGQVLAVPAKPAKIPSAPKSVAPAAAPVPSTASSASTASSGGSYATASTAEAAPVQKASTYTASSGSFQACVIAAESGGNSQVMNSSGHYGLYQFSASTWAAYGGNPADFGNASVAEQNQVFDNAIAAGGESNWAPYDGC